MTEYRKVHEGVATTSEHFALLNARPPSSEVPPGEPRENWYLGRWWEITDHDWRYFLEILPPMHFDGANFAMCEFTTGNVTSAFFHIENRFFCGYVDGRTSAGVKQMRAHIWGTITGRETVHGDDTPSA